MIALSATTLQRLIALPFVTLGAWALLAPTSVQQLAIRPEAQDFSPVATLLMQCFGAQAILCSLFILTSRFTRYSFLAYGIALLPFFWFNYYFVFVMPLFTIGMMIDFVANVGMLFLCLLGWRAAVAEGR